MRLGGSCQLWCAWKNYEVFTRKTMVRRGPQTAGTLCEALKPGLGTEGQELQALQSWGRYSEGRVKGRAGPVLALPWKWPGLCPQGYGRETSS